MFYIIGAGPGDPEYLLPAAVKAAQNCQVLAGGRRALELFPQGSWDKFQVTGDLAGLKTYLEHKLAEGKNVGLLVSGDPGFYSLLPFIRRHFPMEKLEVIPGIGSLQAAFAKANLPWQGASLLSVHGRPLDCIDVNPNVCLGLLTGSENTPQRIAAFLLEHGPNRKAFVGDNLTYPNEIWLETDLTELERSGSSYANSVLIVTPADSEENRTWTYSTPGIPDSLFTRGEAPMTKEEIRVLTLAKARLKPDSIVYDIGAGTGSISVEAALLAPRGRVYAIEREEDALELIKQNCGRFGAPNVEIISGQAPAALTGLPKANVIIIGGSGGSLKEIICQTARMLQEAGRIVINAVTLETLFAARETLEQQGFKEIEIISVAVTRWPKVGRNHMANALNPVFVISAELRSGLDVR